MKNIKGWKTKAKSIKKSKDGLTIIFQRSIELRMPVIDLLNAYPLIDPAKRKVKRS